MVSSITDLEQIFLSLFNNIIRLSRPIAEYGQSNEPLAHPVLTASIQSYLLWLIGRKEGGFRMTIGPGGSQLFGLIYLGSRNSARKYFLSVVHHLAIHILSVINPCSFVRLLLPFPNVLIHALPRIIANAMNSTLHPVDFHYVLLFLNKLGSTHLIWPEFPPNCEREHIFDPM